jgi:uroporphyrinogen-III synthase
LADSFLRHLEVAPCPSEPVGLPRGHLGDPTLQRRLEAAGLDVVTLVLYETVSLPWSADAEIDAIVLASPSAVRALPERVAAGATLVTLGPSTSGAVRALGLQPNEVAEPSTDAILERLTHLRRR